MSRSIFISRDLNEDDSLIEGLKNANFEVYAFSLITIETYVFTLPKFDFDWVFLASSNAARIFLPSTYEFKIGVAGPATAKAVNELGFAVDFIGQGGDMMEVGSQFAQKVGSAIVLFPCAEEGSKKIQRQLPKDQVIDFPIYRSVPKRTVEIPETDLVFLSSPSNAKAYLDRKSLNGKTTIAIGQTTKEFLLEKAIDNVKVPTTPEPDSILDLILSL